MYRVLVAQPPIIRIGVGDHVWGEHVISNSRSHIPPPSSNYRHSREGGNPESQGSWRWPWTPAFAGVTKTRLSKPGLFFLLVQPVQPHGAAGHDLVLGLRRQPFHAIHDHLRRAGEEAVRVRVV